MLVEAAHPRALFRRATECIKKNLASFFSTTGFLIFFETKRHQCLQGSSPEIQFESVSQYPIEWTDHGAYVAVPLPSWKRAKFPSLFVIPLDSFPFPFPTTKSPPFKKTSLNQVLVFRFSPQKSASASVCGCRFVWIWEVWDTLNALDSFCFFCLLIFPPLSQTQLTRRDALVRVVRVACTCLAFLRSEGSSSESDRKVTAQGGTAVLAKNMFLKKKQKQGVFF